MPFWLSTDNFVYMSNQCLIKINIGLNQCLIKIYIGLNPKKAGSFDPISQPGGGGGVDSTPPLGSRPRSGEKIM